MAQEEKEKKEKAEKKAKEEKLKKEKEAIELKEKQEKEVRNSNIAFTIMLQHILVGGAKGCRRKAKGRENI